MKKLNLIFIALVTLAVLIVPVIAQEEMMMAEEPEITVGGIDICLIMSSISLIIFGFALYLGFKLVKPLYGGRFTNALPYLLIAISLLFGMEALCLFGDIYGVIGETTLFAHGIQMLQLLAGVFFISALYSIYQTRFATAGFIGGEK